MATYDQSGNVVKAIKFTPRPDLKVPLVRAPVAEELPDVIVHPDFDLAEWFKPPKVFYLAAALAGAFYLYSNRRK
jgi:hypothetical protein